ncbi:SRPBCC domain-containing protein [Sphingomonas sp.]|uniref:SRPBCC domain-containing protein n=1 Tax=Sphingomonas sp. TaxID=28214 RepID=UPI001EB72B8F|nr:SRPBCC domain-containing protein [Sphingomonas sp.]MBX3593600.1 SRPBCC domain-containing protein [Sphingomonas sp.]
MRSDPAPVEILAPDTLRIERILDAPPATVWRYLAEAELRRRWFAGGTDAAAGGEVGLVFDHENLSANDVPYPEKYAKYKGASARERVVEFDPPRVLAIGWDGGKEGVARFELSDAPGGRTRLVLTHSGISGPAPMANFGGGWHSHLAVLEGLLNGEPVRDFWALHASSEAKVAAALAESSTS